MENYDYLIIGTGMSALASGALLANAGYKVMMLEAHDKPGGYAHTFNLGEFQFCAQVHYIWGCAPGQVIHQFLKHLGLEKDITFKALAPDGYDQVVLPDGKRIKIPYGFEELTKNIEDAYPGQQERVQKFLSIIEKINHEIAMLPLNIRWWHYLTKSYRARTLLKYKNKTLQDVFDVCQLSKESQAILCANAGDLGAPPELLSVLAYTSLFSGYNGGAYYPTKHFRYFIERLAQFITDKPGCKILYQTEVTGIEVNHKQVLGVRTADGTQYQAKNYICNMDPQKASNIIGLEWFNKKQRKQLSYDYSPSSVVTYIGVEGIDLRDYDFGNFNIWHLEQWNMNTMWKEPMLGHYKQAWFFLSSPSLRTSDNTLTKGGGQTLQFGTLINFDAFLNLKKMSPLVYKQKKQQYQEDILDIIEEKYIPNFRQYIKVIATGTPLTNERFCHAPLGNCYGSTMTPENMGLARLKSETPWKNFHWCNASSGYAGIHGTVTTGIALYTTLSGDQVLTDGRKRPSAQETIRYAKGC